MYLDYNHTMTSHRTAKTSYQYNPNTRVISGPGINALWSSGAFAALEFCKLLTEAFDAGIKFKAELKRLNERDRLSSGEYNHIARAKRVLTAFKSPEHRLTFDQLHAIVRGGRNELMRVVHELELEEALRATYYGGRRSGYQITELGLAAAREVNAHETGN